MRFDIHPFKTVGEAREWAYGEIDACAGRARARYLTVTAGQDATYAAKYADSHAFRRAGYPDEQIAMYPWVHKEAEAIGATFRAAADGIMMVGDSWNNLIGPTIEGLRIGGKVLLPSLTSVAAVLSHANTVVKSLDAA